MFDRRCFLQTSAASVAALPTLATAGKAASPRGSAEHVIMLWLGGGMSQIDTFDPKRRSDPEAKTKSGRREPGSDYAAIATAAEGVEVCEHLPGVAARMDRLAPLRTVNHDVIDEHAAAAYRMHIGRPVSGTVVYPTLASLVSAMKGPGSDEAPSYVLMGTPSPGRSPGFLGAEQGFLYLPSTAGGPRGLARPQRISDERATRRQALLAELRRDYVESTGDRRIADYATAQAKGFELAGPEFMRTFDLESEPATLRESYGDEFGQRCLLARRLIERGTRFVEVSFNINFTNGTGWDTHNEGQAGQHLLIRSLDAALATLIDDLEDKKLLDRTLLFVNTEFGRPPTFDGGGGRGHQGAAFTCVLGGGGLATGQAIGQTDELGAAIVDRPISVPDVFATVLASLGCDPHEELYAGARPVPATDGGEPIAELFG